MDESIRSDCAINSEMPLPDANPANKALLTDIPDETTSPATCVHPKEACGTDDFRGVVIEFWVGVAPPADSMHCKLYVIVYLTA